MGILGIGLEIVVWRICRCWGIKAIGSMPIPVNTKPKVSRAQTPSEKCRDYQIRSNNNNPKPKNP